MYFSDLNYPTYKEYLESKEWQEIKDFFYRHCGPYECRLCPQKHGLVLHKRSYKYLTLGLIKKASFGLRFLMIHYLKKNMVWLCSSCHNEVHHYNPKKQVPLVKKSLCSRENYLYWRNKLLRFVSINTSNRYKKA